MLSCHVLFGFVLLWLRGTTHWQCCENETFSSFTHAPNNVSLLSSTAPEMSHDQHYWPGKLLLNEKWGCVCVWGGGGERLAATKDRTCITISCVGVCLFFVLFLSIFLVRQMPICLKGCSVSVYIYALSLTAESARHDSKR